MKLFCSTGILVKQISIHVADETPNMGGQAASGNPRRFEYEAKSLSTDLNGHILVSCEGLKTDTSDANSTIDDSYRELGLFVIDSDGLVQQTVARGRYWDVTCDSNYVFSFLFMYFCFFIFLFLVFL